MTAGSPAPGPLPVLLVHGLGRTPLSLLALGRRLASAGAHPAYFGYYAWAESHGRIVDRLARRLQAMPGPAGLVGHSLGGLLLREAIPKAPGLSVRHLVMLGTPNQPPRLAHRVRRWIPFRALTRSAGQWLADPARFAGLPAPGYPCTVIAGTAGRRGRWSLFGGDPNDGFVAVDETRLATLGPPTLFPVRHTFMMNNRAVQASVLQALGLPSH